MTLASRCRTTSLLLLVAVSALVSRARADDTEGEGERLVRQGVELRTEGRNREALEAFQQARVLLPTPRVQAQIALAHQALGGSFEPTSERFAWSATSPTLTFASMMANPSACP